MLNASGLYVITPEGLPAEALLNKVDAALSGGAVLVQYRDKNSEAQYRYGMAKRLQALCAAQQVPLIINDDVALAVRVQAAGVHLGREDGSVAAARSQLGDEGIIGVSCYNDIGRAERAQQQGADYVAFGRFFVSKTKPEAELAALSLLAEARKKIPLPIVAIGGITLDNGRQLMAQGADYLAVVQGVFGAADIAGTASRFQQWFIKE